MNNKIQKLIIDKNIKLIKKRQIGFINTYCDLVKNQIINNISICDKFENILNKNIKNELHNIETELIL